MVTDRESNENARRIHMVSADIQTPPSPRSPSKPGCASSFSGNSGKSVKKFRNSINSASLFDGRRVTEITITVLI